MDSSTNISNRASSTLSEVDSRFKAPIHSCDVIQLATELLHSSSSESELKQLKKQLSMIEKHIAEFVDVYFEGFNKSIRSHTNILQQLMIAQKGVSDLTETLTDSSEILQCKNDDLVKLWKSHIENLGILSLVDQIKWLITVPSDSKSYLSQAYPLHSALLLRKGIQCIRPLEAVQGITELSAQLFAERKKVCDFAQKSILAAMYLQITERGNTELKRKDLFLPLHRNGANYRRMNYPHQYEGSINDAVIAEDEDLNETLSPNTELFLKNSIHAVFLLDKEEEVSKEIVEGVAEKFEEFLNSNLKIQNIVSSLYPSEKTIEELRSYLSQFSGKIVSVLHNYSLIAKYYSLFEKNYHSDDKSTFPILSIWNRMQDILISFLRISVLGEVFVSSVPRGDNEVKQNKLFSFSNNVVANNDHSSFFANGSPKYMFAVFPFLESIQNSAIQILQSIYPSVQLQTNTHTHLVSFAREFTQQCFVAGASQEGRERCRKLLDSIHSADLVYTRYGMIMKSAIDMIGLVTQLHTDALRLKAARKVFYKLVCSFCSRFISKCEDLFGTLAGKMDSNDPESESDEKSLKFTMRLMNERTTPFDFKKSQFAEIGPKSDKSANSSKDKKKSEKAMNFDQFYDINYVFCFDILQGTLWK